MSATDILNAWGASWASFMVRALVDSTVLLALVVLLWLPLRKKMSAQFAHGLFLLVVLKLAVPIPVSWPSWASAPSLRQSAARFSAWAIAGAPVPPPAAAPATLTDGPADDPILVAAEPEPIVAAAAEMTAPAEPSTAASSPGPASRPRARPPLSVAAMLMLAWSGLVVLLLGRFARALWSTHRLMREALPVPADAGWFPVDFEALRRAAGVRMPVRWAVSPKVVSPAVGGLVRPTVIIPPDLDDGLTPKQLTWVLLHELAHVRRGDLWVVTVQRLVQALFFFHPAVHLANWIIDQLREYACDDAALAAGGASRHDCGEGFLTIVGRTVEAASTTPVPALGLFESRMLIRRRLLRILDSRRPVHERLSTRATAALLVMALIVLPYGRVRDAAADVATDIEPPRPEAEKLAANEPRLFAPGATFLHDDRAVTSGSRRKAVLAAAYSPDGRIIATAGEDAAIILRDAATAEIRARLTGHGDTVTSLVFSPDGRTLASASYDRTIRLWDVATARTRATLDGHESWVFALAFRPDGRQLASAGSDRTIRLWDAVSGSPDAVLAGPASAVRAVAFSPDGRLLASAGADRVATIWDVRTRLVRAVLKGHSAAIRAVAFAPDGKLLATAGEEGEIKLWEPRSGREAATLTGHGDMVLTIAFSPGGATLASGGLDTVVKLWDTKTGRERATLPGHGEGVAALAFAPAARQLATAGYDGSVKLWDPAAPTLSAGATLDYPDEAWAVAFSPDGKTLYATGKAGVISLYNPAAALLVDKGINAGGWTLAVSPDGATLATGDWDGRIRLIDAKGGRAFASLDGHRGGVRSVAFSPDGKRLASGGEDGKVTLWDKATRAALRTIAAGPLPVTGVRFSPDGKTLAVSTGDWRKKQPGTVLLVDPETGAERAVLRGHGLEVAAIAYSPDGATLASAGADGFVRLWDAVKKTERCTLNHADGKSVAFSPDGRFLASGHYGGDVVLWDAVAGRRLATLKGHRDLVFSVAFSPDGKVLASASKDKTVRLWNLDARKVAPRASLKGEIGCLGPVVLSPDGSTLAVAAVANDAPGDIALWDLGARRVKAVLAGHERGVASLAYSPDGRTLASSSWDMTIRLWDAATGASRGEFATTEVVARLAFSPDGKTLAAAAQNKVLTLWDVEAGGEIARFDDFRGHLYAVAFSPDGRQVAVGGGGNDGRKDAFGEVRVFDVGSQNEVADLAGHTGSVIALVFGADGTLATGGVDSTVRLWDVAGGRARLALGGFPDCVRALGVSPDGRTLAVAGRGDGVVTLFDTHGGGELARLVGHGARVLGLAFTPDGRTLATGSLDSTIKLWDVPSTQAGASRPAGRP